jgi:multidrug efflux pump subunit AcrB
MLMGTLSVRRMPTDVLPPIDVPVVIVIWNYPGLSAEDMERRVTLLAERGYSTVVDGIDHIESDSIAGVALIKLYFAEEIDIGAAIAQVAAVSASVNRWMPPGMQPPSVLRFNASNVPVAQMTLASDTMSQQQIFDYAQNFLRLRLFTIPGLATPPPYGGNGRQVSVDIDPGKLAAKQLAPQDVVTALLQSNVILPAGTARVGDREYDVQLNGSPVDLAEFNRIPVKVVQGAVVHLGEVAHVHDGYAPQQNIVRINGRRATYLAVLKKSNASTTVVVDAARAMIPLLKAAAPTGLEIKLDFDQSIFVRAAIRGVLHEAALSGLLVALMTLAFLGSWRSVVVVCTSIPLAVMASLIGLYLGGHTLNLMTLGGLALSIGMLVDDATVEVENIHRNRLREPRLVVAILDSAHQVATPALATTLTICIVFFPVALLEGPARFLFIPLALAVVMAMVASYVLSRTLVPSLAHLLLRGEPTHGAAQDGHGASLWQRFNGARDRAFERFEQGYGLLLEQVLAHPRFVLLTFAGLLGTALWVAPSVGLDFFPRVDTGQIKLHFRAPMGTRIEETERLVARLDGELRKLIPADELATINDNIGLPIYINLAYVPTDNIGGQDADILIALKPKHRPSQYYMERIRAEIAPKFPGSQLYFQPADLVSQVLNFGLSAPIDIQIQGPVLAKSYEVARRLLNPVRKIPGVVDLRIPQVFHHPAVRIDVERERASLLGLTQRDVASSLLTSLTGSSLIGPSFWLNPSNNVNYSVIVQTPITTIDSLQDITATPLGGGAGTLAPATGAGPVPPPQGAAIAPYLGSIARLRPSSGAAMLRHFTVQPTVDLQLDVEGRDLGSVARDVDRELARLGPMPKGTQLRVRGQSEAMRQSFEALGLGIAVAIALVYLLLVVLLQSWLDPFIILVALAGALIGIVWILALTGSTFNVESLMGSIMVVGIAVSNSNLLVSFANELRAGGHVDAARAAVEAGKTRLRPVLMTAIAMVLGMLPMALALGEGGAQNAPLGRAVIGGLVVATFVTLFIVPLVYARLRTAPPPGQRLDDEFLAATGEVPHG